MNIAVYIHPIVCGFIRAPAQPDGRKTGVSAENSGSDPSDPYTHQPGGVFYLTDTPPDCIYYKKYKL